jgi:heat shock protein HtpX
LRRRSSSSRSREYGADRAGAEFSDDPEALVSALQKLEAYSKRIPLPVNPAVSHLFIVKPLTGAAFGSLFSTHPSTEQRVARLRTMVPSRTQHALGADDSRATA